MVKDTTEIIIYGMIAVGTQGYGSGYEMPRRVYDPNGIAPAIRTFGGGNLEPKVVVYENQTSNEDRLD